MQVPRWVPAGECGGVELRQVRAGVPAEAGTAGMRQRRGGLCVDAEHDGAGQVHARRRQPERGGVRGELRGELLVRGVCVRQPPEQQRQR